MIGTTRIQNILNALEGYKEQCQKTIDVFQSNFASNPRNALSSADRTFLAVSTLASIRDVERRLTAFLEGDDLTTDEIMESLDKVFRIKLESAGMSGDKSTCQRSMDLADTEIGSKWFISDYSRYLVAVFSFMNRNQIAVALQEVVAERVADGVVPTG